MIRTVNFTHVEKILMLELCDSNRGIHQERIENEKQVRKAPSRIVRRDRNSIFLGSQICFMYTVCQLAVVHCTHDHCFNVLNLLMFVMKALYFVHKDTVLKLHSRDAGKKVCKDFYLLSSGLIAWC